MVAHLRDRARRRLTVTAVAETGDGVVASGIYNPVGDTAEVLAVATLPAARRQGFAGSVTAGLVRHARENGVRLLLLSAESDDVARVYAAAGVPAHRHDLRGGTTERLRLLSAGPCRFCTVRAKPSPTVANSVR